MKKVFVTLILSLFLPLNIFAYSENVIPGGENIGIKIESKGLLVIGYYKVKDKYIAEDTIKISDKIIKIEGKTINNVNEMTDIINSLNKKDEVNITVIRNKKEINTKLKLILDEGVLKTGLYVKDEINGIGTISYIDPNTKIYGALGHEVIESNTRELVEVKTGNIFSSNVTGIDRSINGSPGSKNATINYNNILGSVEDNTTKGIYGKIDVIPDKNTIKVADFEDIEKGEATIYTTLNGEDITKYKIKITDIDKSNIDTSKSISFDVIDKKLLEQTGGIVQGMSGSPIIQNKKIIGAVTHVVVDDVTRGYGIFIRTMLEQGEKSNK